MMTEIDHKHFILMRDYNLKVSRDKQVMPKSEAYGGAKISSHGSAVGLVIPEFVWAPIILDGENNVISGTIDYRNFPSDAVPGKMLWLNLIIASNGSAQCAVQTYVT